MWLPSLSYPSVAGHDDADADCNNNADDDTTWIRGGEGRGGGGAAEGEVRLPSLCSLAALLLRARQRQRRPPRLQRPPGSGEGRVGSHRPEGEAGGAAGGLGVVAADFILFAKNIFASGWFYRL